jgi:eukaryotic-like serine/threonine-protein kinase
MFDRPQPPSTRQAASSVTGDVKKNLTEPAAGPNGRYRIVSDLGAGPLGNVCIAEDEATGHEVAIRLLPRGLAGSPYASQTRQRTGGSIISASGTHPALVRVLELGNAENGHGFVAMELARGRRLSDILSEGPLEVDVALRMAVDLGGAVEALHSLGLVHGALRPRNVMVRKDGGVKLMDVELIGLREARAMKRLIAEEAPPEYLSPEQINGQPATEATDVYAFAAIVYEMLCGKPPFQAETREAVLAKHLGETPVPMRRRRRAVPGSLESVVALALSKPPNVRPSIQNLLNHLWEEANRPATPWKRKAAIVGGGVLAVSIPLIVGLGLLAPRPSAPPPPVHPAPPAAARVPISPPAPLPAPSTEVRPAPTPATPIPAVTPSAARVPISPPAPLPAPSTDVRPAPAPATPIPAIPPPAVASTPQTATPAVAPPAAARATPPAAPAPASARPRAERRGQPPAPPAPADPPREQAAAPNREATEFDAAIDWLLGRSSAGKQ